MTVANYFNPHHSSNMGGIWEGIILLLTNTCCRSHEILFTLISEVMSILNARSLVPVSSDQNMPMVLTAAMLRAQKTEPLSPGDYDLKNLYNKKCNYRAALYTYIYKT